MPEIDLARAVGFQAEDQEVRSRLEWSGLNT